ncbi:MraY family glycosyltransferase [Pseudomonas guariconensis]|uniref:MraY family glycosyltransferase n=1 Tax=Pseudomonas guariconensis TaxID=1288410 RepID=UPI002D1EFC5D|nr:glycosyltransferase family 4 protein [Pseudomonas guariconensis]MEB3842303.1 glycosyltransferase family 4 protein [Pseudomonas guariconensis]MEB3875171.1 glycosyltransferase family 4 protein [Pseudomonas guariconensis]MEB3877079.1 glycosyltransferase family 4 protein [Pseudomonas guariconensis]MEB3894706.1 glycosyltransferase family 4 protein [Pseudomonas guariconensis]
MTLWLMLLILVILAWLMTRGLRRYALARSIIDIPNARSSHSVPTPRGGGIAIVLSFLIAVPFFANKGLLDWSSASALLGAGAGTAILGFLDDHGHIAARWRLLGHFLGASWVIFWLGGLSSLDIFGYRFDFGWVGGVFTLFYLVWLLNLYNFMDGIDGLASVEAICVSCGGAFLYILSGNDEFVWGAIALACATLGFLIWNFPPAKIFMGDAGSGFLGISLGILSLQAAGVDSELFFGWLILLGVFIVDATVTLLRRMLKGARIYEAHRSHAYQYASRYYGGHKPVTLTVLFINVVWLLPLASLVALKLLDGWLALAISYVPLVLLALRFRAGETERT